MAPKFRELTTLAENPSSYASIQTSVTSIYSAVPGDPITFLISKGAALLWYT